MGIRGSTESRKILGRRTACVVAVAFCGLFLGLFEVSLAPALEPSPPDKAAIVFSNGGRIVRINADGTGRTVLTRKNSLKGGPVKRGSLLTLDRSDVMPRVSPDGGRIMFSRTDEFDDDLTADTAKTMIVSRDGGPVREILKARKGVWFSHADWLPGGIELVAARLKQSRRRIERSIVIVKPNGQVARTVLRLRPYVRGKNGRWPRAPMRVPAELAASPDGSALLATIRSTRPGTASRLERIDIRSGRRKVIARQAGQAAWSPDGESVVFVSKRDRNGCAKGPFEPCAPAGELYIATEGGSTVTRLTRTRADESSPSWSPDGRRIAYSSNRNLPRSLAAREIYSMASDGTCRTWLTNGAPASIGPEWSGSADDRSDPASCDVVERPALAEIEPRFMNMRMARPRLWLGPEFEGRLLSDSFDLVLISGESYEDCAWYEASRCRKPLAVVSFPVCFLDDLYLPTLAMLSKAKVGRERGATVLTDRETTGRLLLSGGMATWITTDDPFKAVVSAQGSRAIQQLRPFGASSPGRLPAARIPGVALRKMLKAKRVVRRTASRRQAAKRLGISPAELTERLKALRVARKLGPLRRVRCNPRLVKDPLGFDAGFSLAGSSRSGEAAAARVRGGRAARLSPRRLLRSLGS